MPAMPPLWARCCAPSSSPPEPSSKRASALGANRLIGQLLNDEPERLRGRECLLGEIVIGQRDGVIVLDIEQQIHRSHRIKTERLQGLIYRKLRSRFQILQVAADHLNKLSIRAVRHCCMLLINESNVLFLGRFGGASGPSEP